MEPEIKLFNTLGRKIEKFTPMQSGKVGLYTCGPTVYGYAHIGNLRSYIFADLLRRMFEYFNYDVKQVMNITDVGHLTSDADDGEDKMEVGAKRENLTAWDVAKKYTDAFFEHTKKLNIKTPHIVCKVTDHIQEQIDLILRLEKNGFTYKTSDGIYFDTSKFPRYGDLAKLDIEGLEGGIRVDQAEKRSKTDFALWKFSPTDVKRAMEWAAPWGRGFPGWHIECSAMSMKYLGEQFDVHTGGIDHIPVHHSNELAQCECATGKTPVVKYWMHGEFLVFGDYEKMSKSKGNVFTLDDLVDKGFDPLDYRYFCVGSHYRRHLSFTYEGLKGASIGFLRLKERINELSKNIKKDSKPDFSDPIAKNYLDKFQATIASDLSTPETLANLWTLLGDNKLSNENKYFLALEHDKVFALNLDKPISPKQLDVPDIALKLLDERQKFRKEKKWSEADKVRDKLKRMGFDIVDTAQGPKLKKN